MTDPQKPIDQDQLNWERSVIQNMLSETLVEQRRKRRWGIFFKIIFALYILLFIIALWPVGDSATTMMKAHAALIPINGMIAPGSKASAENLVKTLNEAFEDKHVLGIILDIDSPGGTPVQADYVYAEIKRLRKEHPDIKLYAVCEDICTSGAYYVASAADEVYANEASLIGSIGVLINGFGFVDTMQKLGIERRLLAAGSNKGILDPFSPVEPDQKEYVIDMLKEIHQIFIDRVKAGRGKRLKDDPTLFSGLIWTGEDALKLGLIDGFKSPNQVANDLLNTKKIVSYRTKTSFFERLSGDFGTSFAGALMEKFFASNNQIIS